MTKIAIVTGGTRGIGLAITKALMAQGVKVAATYHGNDAAAHKASQETGCIPYKWDVCDYEQCAQGVETIANELGPVDILVNNAGITRDAMLHKMELDVWNDVIQTNLTSCFYMCKAVLTQMRQREFGRIINISSINGQKGQFGQVNYAAAKAGVIGLTKALALEAAAKNITVNAVCPGYIATDMTANVKADILQSIIQQIPVGRLGEADEIGALVAFLASDQASFITGATMSANGGQYIC